MCLDGTWYFLPDLDPKYHAAFHYKDPEWDRRHWEPVTVPGCWNLYGEKYYLFEGVGWFAREFEVEDLPDDAIGVLRFGAVNYLAHVFLNGELVGTHEGGYTEFTCDVSRQLRKGHNVLVVRADNRGSTIKLPPVKGYYNYGGIHRPVSLEISEGCRIDCIMVHAYPHGKTGEGTIKLQLRGHLPIQVAIVVTDDQGRTVWSYNGEAQMEMNLPLRIANACLWSPDTPYLYCCTVQVLGEDGHILDEATVSFGVRRLEVRGRQLFLNGQPIFLRGICYLCDHPHTGITYDEKLFACDIADFEELGLNAIRCHFPMDERMLDDFDRAGLMVWLEAPIYCLDPPSGVCGTEFKDEQFQQVTQQMVEEMVEQAYNHPSVVIWGVGNECATSHPEANDFFAAIVDTVRCIDADRLIGYASLYGSSGCMAEHSDVVGINQYWGWYDRIADLPANDRHPIPGEPLDMTALRKGLAKFFTQVKDKPALMSEFGADALPGYRDPDRKLWSEDYQAALLEATFRTLQDLPALAGAFLFLYHDYPDPSKCVQAYWDGMNYKGIVSYDRTRKVAFETLKRIYAARGKLTRSPTSQSDRS